MNPQGDSGRPHTTARDGFDVLDACHRQTIFALGKLSALIARLTERGPDDEARALAGEVVQHFSTTTRQHHEDEERHLCADRREMGREMAARRRAQRAAK